MQNLEQMTFNRKEQYLIDAIKYILEKTYNDLFPIQAAERYEAHSYQTDTATIGLFMNWADRIQKPQYLKLFTGRGNILIATNKAAVDGACNEKNPLGYIKDYWGRPGNTEIVVFPGLIAALYISENLEQIVPKLKQLAIAEAAKNPYIIGDPVAGNNYTINQLARYDLTELWLKQKTSTPVLLTGSRRGGKTSTLLNLEKTLNECSRSTGLKRDPQLPEQVKVAYTNYLGIYRGENCFAETLLSITDKVAESLDITPPNDEDMIADPRNTFENFLNSIANNQLLIIAIDEWESIPRAIKNNDLPIDFPEFLLNSIKGKNITLIIAGLHDFEDINRPYLKAWKEAFTHVKLTLLENDISTTESILTRNFNYEENFFNYDKTAIEKIATLTNGQPYLVQNIAHEAIWNYKCLTEETQQFQGNLITEKDINEVINNSDFYSSRGSFFRGLWQQAKNLSEHSHEILQTLAESTNNLTTSQLESTLNINSTQLQTALKLLEKRQIITNRNNHWNITIEIFKIWILEHKDS